MKKIRVALLAAISTCTWSIGAFAQDDEEAAGDEVQAEEGSAGEGVAGDEAGDEQPAGDAVPAEEDKEGLGGICEIDPEACPQLDFAKEAARDLREELFAVQQLFVLRNGRVELQPYWGFTLNDQFVSHPGPGLALNYWITNVLAVGVNGNYYGPFNTDSQFNFETRRAARIGVPLTEYNWGANFNFTYTPVFGKFAGFGDFIFQYDAYVVGGVGAIATRPIAVIDPDNRAFDYETRLAFNAGIGLRVFFNRWFAVTMEIRDYIFNDQLENTQIPDDIGDAQDPANWFGDQSLTNNVTAQLGVSVFIPFSFEYRLPK